MNSFNFPPEASQSSKEENPRRMTDMQMKLEKTMPRNEKSERTKSFNIDFSKMKEENESFRSTTPQPIPLLSAFCTIEKKNEYAIQNGLRKFRKIPEESFFSKKSCFFHFFLVFSKKILKNFSVRPLSEMRSNYPNNFHEKETFLENNINIKVNITVNSGSARTKDKKSMNNVKIIDQKIKHTSITTLPMAIKKMVVCENQEKNPKKTMIHGDNQIVVKAKKEGEIAKNKTNNPNKLIKNNGNSNVVLHKNNFQAHLSKNAENNEKIKKETKDEGFYLNIFFHFLKN